MLLLAVHRAITRPALFDDLPALTSFLGFLVAHGEPWHPVALATALVGAHLVVGALRQRLPVAAVASLARDRRVAIGLGVAVAAIASVAAFPRAKAEPHPLVIVLGVDALRPDRLAANGATRGVTPHIDALVKDATLFDRAYTPIAQTEPAWRALLTARFPLRTQVRYPLTAESRWEKLPTFAQTFGAGGFHTVFHTDCSRFNFQPEASGFDERIQPPRGAVNFALEKLRFRTLGLFADNRLGSWLLPEFVDNRALAGIHNPIAFAERLGDELVARAKAGPTLFAFHATAAHFPGDPVYPFYRRFVSPSEPLARRLRMFFSPIGQGSQGGWNERGAEDLYDELISQADAQVGILLDRLRAAGLYDEATIIFYSDHGESFHADHPELAGATPVHGARLSEEENRIVFAVKLPRSSGSHPARSDALVRLIDLGPTLLDAERLPPLEGADGRSLLPLLEGKPWSPEPLYAETGFTHASPEVFAPHHRKGAPRSFDIYRVRPDGVVEVTDAVHPAVIAEKDTGAFDGTTWIVRAPQDDGSVAERCSGKCPAPELSAWLERLEHANGVR